MRSDVRAVGGGVGLLCVCGGHPGAGGHFPDGRGRRAGGRPGGERLRKNDAAQTPGGTPLRPAGKLSGVRTGDHRAPPLPRSLRDVSSGRRSASCSRTWTHNSSTRRSRTRSPSGPCSSTIRRTRCAGRCRTAWTGSACVGWRGAPRSPSRGAKRRRSPWPRCWRWTRRSSYSTSPPQVSTPGAAGSWSTSSWRRRRRGRRSSPPPTTCTSSPRSPAGWWCSGRTGASSRPALPSGSYRTGHILRAANLIHRHRHAHEGLWHEHEHDHPGVSHSHTHEVSSPDSSRGSADAAGPSHIRLIHSSSSSFSASSITRPKPGTSCCRKRCTPNWSVR